MAIMLSHPSPIIRPPSPALTDPDMILPYGTIESKQPESSRQDALAAELTPPQSSRPILPGAWFSEEDIHAEQLQTISENKNLKPQVVNIPLTKSPVARFLNTVDPKMRHGIGIEVPEYSPSVYSPISPQAESPEDQDEMYNPMFEAASPTEEKPMFDDDDDDIMGSRAEEILANAKQRLLAMENNLNRARTLSLGATSEAPIEQPRTPVRLQKTTSASHLRMSSETRLSNNASYEPYVRSASALDSPNPFSSFIHKHHHLEPLDEDELLGSPSSDLDTPRTSMKDLQEQMNILKGKVNTLKQKSREDSLRRRSLQALKAPSPFTNADIGMSSPYLPHMRPASNSSDRSQEFLGDPTNAVQDIGSRSPDLNSPLVKFKHDEEQSTAEETFFEEGSEQGNEINGRVGDRRSVVLSSAKDPDLPTPASETAVFDYIKNEPSSTITNPQTEPQAEISTSRSSSPEPEAIIPSSPTYDASLGLHHSAIPIQTSPAHEDRPDAFDYETYILNSTMGSFSRNGFRPRRDSVSSAGSGSTQRPVQDQYNTSTQSISKVSTRLPHHRTDSADSTSSTATFATAVTGRNDSRAASRAHVHSNSLLSPQLPPKSSYTNLRQAITDNLAVPNFARKRNSYSPLASPSTGAFPLPDDSSLSASEARQKILALLLRSVSTPSTPKAGENNDFARCWAPEDEQLVGSVIDGLVKVVGRIVIGDDEGDAGRSILESIGAVLRR